MSKMKLLEDVVNDLHRLADSLHAVADSIAGNSCDREVKAGGEPSGKQIAPLVTIDQVRAVLAEKSGQGKTAEVKALLYKYDAGKLSGVKQEDYAALLEEAMKL